MNVVAYCASSYEGATSKAVGGGVDMLTSPPLTDVDMRQLFEVFEHRDIIVLNLHGVPHGEVWFGGGGVVALTSSTLRSMSLGGAAVFAINCYLGDSGQPMFRALGRAGAGYLIAGAGENYGGVDHMVGADVLLRWFLVSMRGKAITYDNLKMSLQRAKVVTLLTAPKLHRATRVALGDALKFKLWRF